VACWVLGLQIDRHGFVPVSGLFIVNDLSLIDVLLLASPTPFVFALDMRVRRRPIVGWLARLAVTLFRDLERPSDVARIKFMTGRALWRRQLVVVFRTCRGKCEPISDVFPSAPLQPAVALKCSLTAAATRSALPGATRAATVMLTKPRSRVAVSFYPPAFHHGGGEQLARQVWREVQALEAM
jgi:hypothetical protein